MSTQDVAQTALVRATANTKLLQVLRDTQLEMRDRQDLANRQLVSLKSEIDDRFMRIQYDIDILKMGQAQTQRDIAGLQSAVVTLQTDVATLQSDVANLKVNVTELRTDMVTLTTEVALLKTDVAELKTDVAGLKADVAELKADVAELKADVAEFKIDMRVVKGGLARVIELLEAGATGERR